MPSSTLMQQAKLVISLSALALAASAQAADASKDAPAASAKDSAAIQAAFKRADANGDGKLSREEAVSLPAVAEKFTQLDKDADGFISAEEFTTGVTTSAPTTK